MFPRFSRGRRRGYAIVIDTGAADERTYLCALDLEDGSLIGTAEVPGRCGPVDVGGL